MAATYTRLPTPDVPKEQHSGLLYGIFGHLGSPAMYVALLAVFGLTPWNAFAFMFVVSAIFIPFTLFEEKRDASIPLPAPTWREVWDGLGMVFIKGIGVGGGFITLGWWLLSFVPLHGPLQDGPWLVAIATVLTDFAYYLIHRFMSHGNGGGWVLKLYRRKHAAHHSVTELDFLRGNQSSLVDTALSQFQPSLIVIAWVLGLDLASTWAAYALILLFQATDHTSVTYNIGPLRYIFMDNHAHKLHHCKRGNLVNHAAAFSLFDRAFGTYYEDWDVSANYLHHHNLPLPIRDASRSAS
jgi:sterol desaturase/sphingolipid hydroxylase (fatty acid hydroxylase superfamily)